MSLANYFFIPSVRQGLAGAIREEASAPRASIEVTVNLAGDRFEGDPALVSVAKTVQLFGPGDVCGFDPRVVARTDPRSDIDDFEPNFFPFIEFIDPDFPWRFTPAAADQDGKLLPWLTLIVLLARDTPDQNVQDGWKRTEFEPGDRLATDGVPWITVSTEHLPDLSEAWRWAHVQVTGDEGEDDAALREAISNESTRAVSRLVCARRLRPGVRYRAFIVPTFKLGALAVGLDDTSPLPSAPTLAWEKGEGPVSVKLPVYYQWDFGTGTRGDFEHLIRLLEARRLSGLGVRPIDCSNAGYGMVGTDEGYEPQPNDGVDANGLDKNVLRLEGALRSKDTKFTPWGVDAEDDRGKPFREKLATELLNRPFSILTQEGAEAVEGIGEIRITPENGSARIRWVTDEPSTSRIRYSEGESDDWTVAGESDALVTDHDIQVANLKPATVYHFQIDSVDGDENQVVSGDIAFVPLPSVVPPIYGRWHAARQKVDETGESSDWINELNLDPRHRTAAGFGEEAIRDHQDALMAEAWRQLGDIEEANEALRHAQLGCEASVGYFDRLTSLVRDDATSGEREIFLHFVRPMHHRIAGSPSAEADSPVVAVSEHFKRIGRAPLDHAMQRVRRSRGPIRKRQRPVPEELRGRMIERLNTRDVVAAPSKAEPRGMIGFGQVMKELLPNGPESETSPEYDIDSEVIGAAVGAGTFEGIELPPRMQQGTIQHNVGSVLDGWLNVVKAEEPQPEADLERTCGILKAALEPRTTVVARLNERIDLGGIERNGDPLRAIMAAPDFPQPMYEALRDGSQERVLPGIEKVPQNTVGVLETNPRFIEAYMCGCNHAFAAELLWREYPTDQRGSYFRQFWDVAGFIPTTAQLGEWGEVVEADFPQDTPDENRNELIEELVWAKIDKMLKDIPPVHEWEPTRLGEHKNPEGVDLRDGLVLIVRGDLFKKYPNTVVYAVKARILDGKRVPDLPEYYEESGAENELIYPLFGGDLPPDTKFFGFPFKEEDARSDGDDHPGMYFVLEERVSEARFGMDETSNVGGAPVPPTAWVGMPDEANLDDWANLNWGTIEPDVHLDGLEPKQDLIPNGQPNWGASSATIAWITVQRPVRIAIHADRMLLPDG